MVLCMSLVSVCVCLRSAGLTVRSMDITFGIHIKDHYISCKYEGQVICQRVTVTRVKVKVRNVKVKGKVLGQGQSTQVIVQVHRVQVKVFLEFSIPLTCGCCNTWVFS